MVHEDIVGVKEQLRRCATTRIEPLGGHLEDLFSHYKFRSADSTVRRLKRGQEGAGISVH